jgi:hypothetical protein
MHPLISAASGSQVASHHYDEAVFNAFKAVEDRVQHVTGKSLSLLKQTMHVWYANRRNEFAARSPCLLRCDCEPCPRRSR